MAKKKRKARKVTARNWGVVALICRSGGKGKHQLKKHPARSTTKAALKKSLMRNNPHEAFSFFKAREWKNENLMHSCFSVDTLCFGKPGHFKLSILFKTVFNKSLYI